MDDDSGSLPWGRRHPAAARLLVGSAIFAIYAVTVQRSKLVNDTQSSSLAAWRIARTGRPWLDGVDWRSLTRPAFPLWVGPASNGHEVVYRSPGSIVAAIPAYLVSGTGSTLGSFSTLPGALTAALLTAVAVCLMALSLRGLVSWQHEVTAVLVLAMTTPFWTVSANALWTHCITVLGVGGMAWAAHRERWWLIGVFGAVGIWGRLHVVVIVAVVGLGLGLTRRRPRIVMVVAAWALGALALQSLWSHAVYGSWLPTAPYYGTLSVGEIGSNAAGNAGTGAVGLLENLAGLLVSPDRGLLIWTPLLVLLLPAVVRSWRSTPDWARVLAVAGVVYLLVQSRVNAFQGGAGYYGYRLTLETLACLFPLYALSAARMGRWAARLIGPLVGLQLAASILGALLPSGLPQQDAWTDNAFVFALVQVPALLVPTVLVVLSAVRVARRLGPVLAVAPVGEAGEAGEAATFASVAT